MAEEKNRWYVKYIICFLVGAALCVFVLVNRNVVAITDKKELFKTLCDAFTVPGVILILFGVLLLIANAGAFDGVSYGIRRAISALIPVYRGKVEKYAEYKEKKEQKREKDKDFSCKFMFFVGLGFFVVSLVFLALYYSV